MDYFAKLSKMVASPTKGAGLGGIATGVGKRAGSRGRAQDPLAQFHKSWEAVKVCARLQHSGRTWIEREMRGGGRQCESYTTQEGEAD